jgi:DNA-binding NarL/FixJ family response regulator
VPEILIATDADSVYNDFASVLASPGNVLRRVDSGYDVRASLDIRPADLAIVDMQIGTMGGVAVALDIHLEQTAGRLDPCAVLLVLDRRADVFLARRSGVAGWILKPLDPIRVRTAVTSLLAGDTWHDPSYLPQPASASNLGGTGK